MVFAGTRAATASGNHPSGPKVIRARPATTSPQMPAAGLLAGGFILRVQSSKSDRRIGLS